MSACSVTAKVSLSKKEVTHIKVNCNLRRFLDALNRDDVDIIKAIYLSIPTSSRKSKDPKKLFADKISDNISKGNIKSALLQIYA